MIICENCKAVNEDGVLFCSDCSALLARSNSHEIARRQATSLCPQCETYNSIELENCSQCGHYLRGDSVVLTKTTGGKLKAVRRRRQSPLEQTGAMIGTLLIILGVGAATGWRLMTNGITGFFADNFGLVLCGFWGVLGIFAWVERESSVVYKFKTSLVLVMGVILGGWYLRATLSTSQSIVLPGLSLDALMLWSQLVVIVFASFCILRGGRGQGIFMALMVGLGIYGLLDPAYAVLSGHGYADYLGGSVLLAQFPLQLQPSFVSYNFFLPYVFLYLLASGVRAYLEGLRQMKQALSATRLNVWNKDALQGSILNLFIVGLPLAFYLQGARALGHENILTYLEGFVSLLSGS